MLKNKILAQWNTPHDEYISKSTRQHTKIVVLSFTILALLAILTILLLNPKLLITALIVIMVAIGVTSIRHPFAALRITIILTAVTSIIIYIKFKTLYLSVTASALLIFFTFLEYTLHKSSKTQLQTTITEHGITQHWIGGYLPTAKHKWEEIEDIEFHKDTGIIKLKQHSLKPTIHSIILPKTNVKNIMHILHDKMR